MGFELEQCQAAVHAGKVTVQSAVDWILQGGASVQQSTTIPSRATPSLSLTIWSLVCEVSFLLYSSLLLFQRAELNDTDHPHYWTIGQTLSIFLCIQGTTSSNDIAYPSFMMPPIGTENTIPASIDETPSTAASGVVSRFLLSDDKREDKNRWEKKKREEDTSWFKEKRKEEKEAKANILREIQADREARKTKLTAQSTAPPSSTPKTSHVGHTTDNGCTLQIRTPSGKVHREKFTAQCTLYRVVERLREAGEDLNSVDFVQFRERFIKVFLEESERLLSDIVQRQDEPLYFAGSDSVQSTSQDDAGCSDLSESENVENLEESVRVNAPTHEEEEKEEQEEEEEEEQHDLDSVGGVVGFNLPPDLHLPRELVDHDNRLAHPRGGRHTDTISLIKRLRDKQGMRGPHDWGEGQKLQGDAAGQGQEDGEQMDESPDSAVVAAAALQRLTTSCHGNAEVNEGTATDKPISSLSDMCFKSVLKSIDTKPDQQATPVHLEAIPNHVAVKLLNELKRSGSLRPKILQLFLPCHLRDLSLDCYKYATNDLLQCVSRHAFLTRLSLTACQFITDQGLLSLTSLKRLQLLNLCNNWQVTDKVFHLVTELSNLTTLILEGTSVTDAGLKTLTSGSNKMLTTLNLNRTSVTDVGVASLTNLPNLSVLGLEKTLIKHLEGVSVLCKLRSLNISRNSLVGTSEFKCLQKLTGLCVLNVGQMEDMMGDAVLFFLAGLGLKQLTLPDRHTTTDEGLKHISNLPLVTLDLTDYIHITDKGIEHIGKIQSLKKLSLSNVKITDASMHHIAGLSELIDLNLDRTLVTNTGAMQLHSLKRLQELSLAETKITSKLLKNGCLNKCVHLTHLNLSRTNVSSVGIKCLILPKLTHLNLDQTYVKVSEKEELMRRCPSIKVLRLTGLKEPPRFLDDEDDVDD
ncbi:hypothetical protein BSL78_21271 [Apostichopus japonicus]|uniref:UBA domain-containing protein n=1 Tax=Stichopus japonicus TaxID=307972 RepID=A0A2G8K1K5_STIJA|nr:hypothetical protein BSL78_21271 [Apostichopus japonicus]